MKHYGFRKGLKQFHYNHSDEIPFIERNESMSSFLVSINEKLITTIIKCRIQNIEKLQGQMSASHEDSLTFLQNVDRCYLSEFIEMNLFEYSGERTPVLLLK